MLSQDIIKHISNLIKSKVENIQAVSGGDISSAYILKTTVNKYFLKVNSNPTALDMFLSEEKALTTILETKAIATPKVLACDSLNSKAFLLMDYIEAKSPNRNELELFGSQLALLHQITSDNFGFDSNNFIGSLHQSNKKHTNWNDFYIEERLIPQLELAKSKGLMSSNEIPNKLFLKEKCLPYFKSITPSLLHGDLWSGNYLISTSGKPYLIDPALYYGHSEIDIAMSKLFGGFGQSFYDSYHNVIPKDEFSEDRVQLYQLYYLLVHLNLFGTSYYSSVKQIMNKFF